MTTKKRLRITLGIGLLALASILIFVRPGNPLYKGKRLNHWFALSLASVAERKQGTEAVRALGPKAVPFLVRRLSSEATLVERLWQRLWPKLPPSVQKHFSPPQRRLMIQLEAIRLLGEVGSPSRVAVPDLIRLLESDLAANPTNAVFAASSASNRFGRPLRALLPMPRIFTSAVAEALGKIGGDDIRIVQTLIKACRLDGDNRSAFSALGSHAVKPAVEKNVDLLIQCLDQENSFRIGALIALAMLLEEMPAILPAVLNALNAESPQVRAQAMVCLREARGGFELFIPRLLEVLPKDYYPRVAVYYSPSFQTAPEGLASRPIYNAFQFPWEVAQQTLQEIAVRSPLVVPALNQALADSDRVLQIRAARILAEIGPSAKESLPRLQELARLEDRELRFAAAWALWRIDRQHEVLMSLRIEELKHPKEETRWSAVTFLGELGSKAKPAVPALAEALKDPSWRVRGFVAKSLAKIGADAAAAVPSLEAALRDEYQSVQEEAAEALKKIRPVP
jgi:HEAT repeat protein